jgi:hypothetical protein
MRTLKQINNEMNANIAFGNIDKVMDLADEHGNLDRVEYLEALRNNVWKRPCPNKIDTLLAKGELLDSLAFQVGAQFTRQALSKAVKARRLFYLEVGGVQAYPAFYLDRGLERKQIEAISKLLGDLSGGSKWLFFTQRSGFLALPETGEPQTPLDALRHGRFEKVKQAARGRAEG